jgi:ribonuclease E
MPSHAKNVKLYAEPMPLFARYQVESYLAGMFNPTVQLRSGGYIVIGITEALVSIDVNSGRATKKGSIEETALETNLEAAEEIARQLRLRDLAGLIVIDFIDMEERKNNAAVEKRFKDRLKTDRARIQVGRISGFGLLEMSRQRLRPGMLEATTQPCPHCHGTGLVRSDDSLGLTILRQIEEEGVRKRSREVLVKAPVAIVNFLMNHKREHIAQIEARYGMSVRVEADPFLISPDFSIVKFKTATRVVEALPVISANAALMPEMEEEDEEDIVETADDAEETEAGATRSADGAGGGNGSGAANGDGTGRKRRRRRRRRRGGNGNGEGGREERQFDMADASDEGAEGEADEGDDIAEDEPEAPPVAAEEAAPAKRSRSRSRSRSRKETPAEEALTEVAVEETPAAEAVEAPVVSDAPAEAEPVAEEKPKRKRAPRKKKDEAPEEVAPEPVAEAAAEPAPALVAEEAPATPAEPAPEPEPAMAEATAEEDNKPKKKGWWSLR